MYKKYTKIRNKVKSETVRLIQQEQSRISSQCKRNPKRFWQFINRKTRCKTGVGDLKWTDASSNDRLAESDKEKAESLQEFFSSVYTLETKE